jgi:hypothetical protein
MESQQQWKQELRGAATVLAVVVALMGFSAALATKEKQPDAAGAAAPSAASQHQDPSRAGLRIAEDAEVDTTVEFHN